MKLLEKIEEKEGRIILIIEISTFFGLIKKRIHYQGDISLVFTGTKNMPPFTYYTWVELPNKKLVRGIKNQLDYWANN